jgi:hypothetical protein
MAGFLHPPSAQAAVMEGRLVFDISATVLCTLWAAALARGLRMRPVMTTVSAFTTTPFDRSSEGRSS